MDGKVVGKLIIMKSFDDDIVDLTKTLEDGDFEEAFQKEGAYLDKLVKVLKEKASSGEGFSASFIVTATKEEL